MGRRAQPIEALKKKGKTHLTRKQIREREEAEARLKAPANAVKPPTWMDMDGRRIWKRLAPYLLSKDLLTNVNLDSLAILCNALARQAECALALQTEGLVIDAPNGGRMQNPYVLVEKKYTDTVRQYAGEFGLTPATLAKLARAGADEEPKDQFEEDMA